MKPCYLVFERLLKSENTSAYKVAKDLEIPYSVLSAWKQSKSHPKGDKIAAIARYFNVPMETFYKKEE